MRRRPPVAPYPYIFEPLYKKIVAAHHDNPKVMARLHEVITSPAFMYRPVPQAMRFHMSQKKFRWCLGGNRSSKCIGANTLIECPDGPSRRVADITSSHHVWAWNGRKRVAACASAPWVKGYAACWRVWTDQGTWFDCSDGHMLLTSSGWLSFGCLRQLLQRDGMRCAGSQETRFVAGTHESWPRPLGSIQEHDLLGCEINAPSYWKTNEGSLSGYLSYLHSHGPLPLFDEESDQVFSPLEVDAPARTFDVLSLCRQGDLGNRSSNTRWRSASFLPSIQGVMARNAGLYDTSLSPLEDSAALLSHLQPPTFLQSACMSDCLPTATSSTVRCCPKLVSSSGCVSIVYIEPQGVQPIYDFEVPVWHNYVTQGAVHHNSHSLAQEVFYFCTGTHPFRKIEVPNTGWYCTITWEKVGDILWDKMERLLYDTPHRVIWHNRNRGIPGIVFVQTPKGESKIIFKAYEQGREIFQGTERRYIANDEQFSQGVYLEQISRIGSSGPLDFFAALTPIEPQPWLEKRLTDSVPKGWDIFEYPLDDNRKSRGGFIEDSEIDALIDEWPEEVQPTRRLGKWSSFLGAVYKTFNRGVHVVPAAAEKTFFPTGAVPNDVLAVGGMDFGGNNPFVFLWAVQLPSMDNEWYVFDEYYWDYKKKGVRLLKQHAEEIKARTLKWKTALRRVWADHDCQDRHEMHASGIATHPAIKDVIAGIETVQSLFKVNKSTKRPRIHIASRCENLVSQTVTYRWPEGSDLRDPQDMPVKKDDHAPDALRYIMQSELRAAPSGRTVTVPNIKRIF